MYSTFYLGTMILIVVLWFGISAPLSAIGAYFGSKHGVCPSIVHAIAATDLITGHSAPCTR